MQDIINIIISITEVNMSKLKSIYQRHTFKVAALLISKLIGWMKVYIGHDDQAGL